MIERVLIFIKHHLTSLWKIIEWINRFVFSLTYRSKLLKIVPVVISEFSDPPFVYRRLSLSDSDMLWTLINQQPASDLEFFHPHGFELESIKEQLRNSSMLMMGSFDGVKMVGYFFLRFFANKKCFVGRLIDKDYRGKGIGSVMNNIMYQVAWRMKFRCLSTISLNNELIMNAHSKNQNMIVLKKLQNDYLLVEFVRRKDLPENKTNPSDERGHTYITKNH